MILDDIRALLDAPAAGPGAPSLAAVEHTLTAGYARALALEAEQRRLQRRISETAERLGHGGPASTGDIARLARRLTRADAELARLRALLALLRDRASELRAA